MNLYSQFPKYNFLKNSESLKELGAYGIGKYLTQEAIYVQTYLRIQAQFIQKTKL